MLKSRQIIIGAFLLLSAGCSNAVYQTAYHYIPPEATSGEICISQCKQTTKMCDNLCPAGEDCECIDDYHACYQLCGGEIQVRRVCIEHC